MQFHITRKPLFMVLTMVIVAVLLVTGCAQKAAPAASPTIQVPELVKFPTAAGPTGWDTEKSLDYSIKLLATFDSSGPPAWDPEKHPLVFITSNGPGYGGILSENKLPGLTIIDGDTKEVVTSQHYDLGYKAYFEPHGLGVSLDGRWIYLPTGDLTEGRVEGAGRWLVINAKTLKINQIIGTKGMPHHAKSFRRADGKELVFASDFNWTGPGRNTGSGHYAFDPNDQNRVVAAVDGRDLEVNPYLGFISPDGKEIWIGAPFFKFGVEHKGSVIVLDAMTWKIKDFHAEFSMSDPIWTGFTADNKYAFVSDGGSDLVYKIDRESGEIVGESRTGSHGVYGLSLTWDEKEVWFIEKGEASHNKGQMVSVVDAEKMGRPKANYFTGCLRGDHITLHPDPNKKEFWLTCNSSFETVVFDYGEKEVIARIPNPLGGSTHSGAFVRYNADFTGEVISDQNGLVGSALELKKKLLGISSG